ncbi:MAG: N-acetylornithine carbamoyltransferase [Bacteroidetes bacterium]|nr:N-acetylornithine carbamoyltransferase [Bacteroidota bacterium]MCH8523715.1 N-acetylornithine carbamoyltransferase [Balneolales bacterium]
MSSQNKHFISLNDWSNQNLLALLDRADELKKLRYRSRKAEGKVLGLLFFNPSLRTKVSFEAAAIHLGAGSSIISPGSGSWTLETEFGAVMNGNKTEHLKEAIQVLSRYCDAIGVRAFSTLKDQDADYTERLMKSVAHYAEVPVINMESAMEHPCQAMADWMTIRELFGKNALPDKKLVLTWAPHPSPLPQAVPVSVLDMASRSGIQVTLACPPEMVPDTQFIDRFKQQCATYGNNLVIDHDQQSALTGADVVYAKSWASPIVYQNPLEEARLRKEKYQYWTLDADKMQYTNEAYFMHCLPVRRNVVVSDDVLDSPNARHIDEAENRLHVQKSILMQLWDLSL